MSLLLALALAAAPAPADFERDEETPLLHFRYGWPAAAQGAPALRARLTREMQSEYRQAVANATQNRREARARGFDYNVEDFDKTWESAGSDAVLLSLTAALGSYSGGAHPNTSYHALLWNLASDRAVTVASVIGPPAAFSARYCAELNRQRVEKREAPVVPDAEDSFTTCPAIAEQVLAPADSDGNGRFDSLRILLAPYAAGPYVEGDYSMDLPLTPQDVARVAEVYRQGFETPGERRTALPDD